MDGLDTVVTVSAFVVGEPETGAPEAVAKVKRSITAQFLRGEKKIATPKVSCCTQAVLRTGSVSADPPDLTVLVYEPWPLGQIFGNLRTLLYILERAPAAGMRSRM